VIFSRAKRESIITRQDGQPMNEAELSLLTARLPEKSVCQRSNKENQIDSLSVPTKTFRRAILTNSDFRHAVRRSDLEITDISIKGGLVDMSQALNGASYVKTTKAVGLRGGTGSVVPLADSIEALQARLEDWAQIKIPAAVLILIAGGTIYGAYKLGNAVVKIGTSYAETLERASSGEEGLKSVLEEKAGGPVRLTETSGKVEELELD